MLYALRTIHRPDSYAAGYQRGDEISEQVARDWGLTTAVDGDVWHERPDGDAPVPTMPRPTEADNRAAWEAYAMANGMDPEKAAGATQEELEAVDAGQPAEVQPETYQAPADSAKKADWVRYVTQHPDATDSDKQWATTDSTTKAELQSWRPGAQPGDTVAVAATEANQAS